MPNKTSKGKPRLYEIHYKILEAIKQHPEGISEGDVRKNLKIPADEQAQFGRRRRDLNKQFRFEKKRQGTKTLYIYRGEREQPVDATPISSAQRARALHQAQGRCQMCGRTVDKHQITLVIDHKIPLDWGGKTEEENLWAICEECNHGKKNLFATMDSPAVRAAIKHKSPHMRIGELLKAVGVGTPVPSMLIEFVAMDQEDWHKRLRELRYLKWTIKPSRKTMPDGRVRSSYTLKAYTDWPSNPSQWAQRYEQTRKHDKAAFEAMKKQAASWKLYTD